MPDASPRSVAPRPQRRSPSQSCGSRIARVAAATSGSVRRSQAQRVIVNEGTGTTPTRSAHPAAPSSSRSASASGAERVSFQRTAGRSGRPSASVTTRPCCCAATEIAATSAARPVSASAARSASHQTAGSVSRAPPLPVTSWGARPEATTSPLDGLDEQHLRGLRGAIHAGDQLTAPRHAASLFRHATNCKESDAFGPARPDAQAGGQVHVRAVDGRTSGTGSVRRRDAGRS